MASSDRSQQNAILLIQFLSGFQEDIRDLLAKDQSQRLELKERPDTGVYVKVSNTPIRISLDSGIFSKQFSHLLQDLSSFVTKNNTEIEHVMNVGNQNRSVGATNMNEHSSRSHAIFIITIECGQVSCKLTPK